MNRRRLLIKIVIMTLILLIEACGGVQTPSAPTLLPTSISASTSTSTPMPTATTVPLATTTVTPAICATALDGLLGWWTGDGNAVDIVGNNNGTLIGNSTFSSGIVNEAFSFPNKGTDWVRIPDNNIWDFNSNSFTIDMWINFNSVLSDFPHQQPLIGHTEGPGQTNKWIFWLEGGGLTFHINSSSAPGFNPVTYNWNPNTGEWYHVAVTRSGNIWKLFVDGQEVATSTDVRAISNASADLTIGKAEETWLEGLVDEVEIYDRALSVEEISSIFNAGAGRCQTGN